MFPQLWGSGSLGYGGMGTTSTVAAYTVIVTYKTKHFVYFGEGGRLAYCIDESIASLSGISNWRNDIGMRNIAPISKMSRYE
jgi:hypothetical protein